MKPEKVFKRYDIRGKYPKEIDEEFAELLGKAIGTWTLKNSTGEILVTKDTKHSSNILKDHLIKGLKSTGATVLDAGTGPTDYTALNAEAQNSVGVQVTSSHLPLEFNGFKLIYPEGNGFLNEDLYEVQDIFRDKDFIEQSGKVREITDSSRERYKDRAKQFFNKYFDEIEGRVVYESMGGAGREFIPEILEKLGAEVIDASDQELVDPPNPKPENLGHVADKVGQNNADIGLATDMDADRLKAYYKGKWLDGNQVFALLAQIIQPERIVASIDTSKVVEQSFNKKIFYTKVGDPFVADKTLDVDAELSGEPNGHYSFPQFTSYNSGTIAGLLIAAADLNEMKIPEQSSFRESIKIEDKQRTLKKVKKKVEQKYSVISEIDGIKFSVNNSEVLLRTSGSSQKLRIIIDADSEEKASKTMEIVRKFIE